jgi:DNA repair exonuclease SbcCD ATPase subunit
MLFGIERLRGRGAASKDDIYTRYLPWDYPGAYCGQMDITAGDRQYRLYRSFHANDKSFSVTDLSTGREVKLKEGLISELVPSLSESVFRNTISIEQLKARTDSELAMEVRNYITNLSIAKSKEVDVAKAVSLLTDKKKALEAGLNLSELAALKEEIEAGKEKEAELDSMTVELNDLLAGKKKLEDEKEAALASLDNAMLEKMDKLSGMEEKYSLYKELSAQVDDLDERIEGLKKSINSFNSNIDEAEIRSDIEQAERISQLLPELAKELEALENSHMHAMKKTGANIKAACLGLWLIATITGFIFLKPLAAGIVSAAGLLIAALLMLILSRPARQRASGLIESLKELGDKLAKEKECLAGIYKKHGITSKKELLDKQEEILRSKFALEHNKKEMDRLEKDMKDKSSRCKLLYDELADYIGYFAAGSPAYAGEPKFSRGLELADNMDSKSPEGALTDDVIESLKSAIKNRRLKINEMLEDINIRLNECNIKIAGLKGRISTLEGNEEQLLCNIDKYNSLMKKKEENELELEAVKLALDTIQSLASDIHDSFGRKLNEAVSGIISNITGQKYNDLKVDEKLNIRVGISGSYVMLDRLSAGTMDQVYFALRLTVADLLLVNDRMPILLDDSFSLYDEQRVRFALKQLADREQVILFSCHDRERQVLDELRLPFNHVELS